MQDRRNNASSNNEEDRRVFLFIERIVGNSFEASTVQDQGLHRCPTMTLSIKNKKTQVYLFPFKEHQLSIISFNVIYHMSQKSS